MAKRIIWTEKAISERKEILSYWIGRNKSKTYSIKLNNLIIEVLKTLSLQPNTGRNTEIKNVRVKIIKDYLLFYEIIGTDLIVLSIWDSRRDKNLSSQP